MPVKFFCNRCEKEIFQDWRLSEIGEEKLVDIERICFCCECQIRVKTEAKEAE